jgi:hypothetical protein
MVNPLYAPVSGGGRELQIQFSQHTRTVSALRGLSPVFIGRIFFDGYFGQINQSFGEPEQNALRYVEFHG